jgi:hypothetical protein
MFEMTSLSEQEIAEAEAAFGRGSEDRLSFIGMERGEGSQRLPDGVRPSPGESQLAASASPRQPLPRSFVALGNRLRDSLLQRRAIGEAGGALATRHRAG